MDGQAVVAAPSTSPGASSRYALWAGRVIGALVVAFLAFDRITKAMKLKPVVETTTRLGYPEGFVFGIGVNLLICTVVCIIPRTAFLGAILLSGYLGGAVATQVHVEDPWFVFPTFVRWSVGVGRALHAR
jgi:DoxX-like protein